MESSDSTGAYSKGLTHREREGALSASVGLGTSLKNHPNCLPDAQLVWVSPKPGGREDGSVVGKVEMVCM